MLSVGWCAASDCLVEPLLLVFDDVCETTMDVGCCVMLLNDDCGDLFLSLVR